MTRDEVFKMALTLDFVDQEMLILELHRHVYGDDPPISDEWLVEIRRRSAEIDAGKAKLIPAEEVHRKLRAKFAQGKSR